MRAAERLHELHHGVRSRWLVIRRLILGAITAVGVSYAPLQGQKTDVVQLNNGDLITGEIKELERGRLRYKTDALSTVYIEWVNVRSITTDKTLEIELASGRLLFGSLMPSDQSRKIRVVGPSQTEDVALLDVVALRTLGSSFWSRLDGFLEFGLTVVKANDARTLNFTTDISYVAKKLELRLHGTSYYQDQEEAEATSRNEASLESQFTVANHWVLGTWVRAEQNEELNLDLRATLIGVGGRVFVQTDRFAWLGVAGVAGNRERFAGLETATNVELVFGTDVEFFVFGDHDTDLSATFLALPSLTDTGRVRLDFDLRVSRDLFLDFYVALSAYDIYDSRPRADNAKSDYGFSFSFGYEF